MPAGLRRRAARGATALGAYLASVAHLEAPPGQGQPPIPAGVQAIVTRGIDGDTIEIEGSIPVRYIGMDTPESAGECNADEQRHGTRRSC